MQSKVQSPEAPMRYPELQSEKLPSRQIWINIKNFNLRLARLRVEKHRLLNLENHPRLQQFQADLER